MSDARTGKRFPLELPIKIHKGEASGESSGVTGNLSAAGVYIRADAALEVVRRMRGAWKLLYVFKIVPRFIRNPLYDWVARNRYRWFGKKDQCMLPTKELKERFL